MSVGALLTAGFLSSGTFTMAVVDTPAPSAGFDLTGLALVISAIAALVTAIGGVLLGLRRSGGDDIDRELKRLLAEKLREEAEEQE